MKKLYLCLAGDLPSRNTSGIRSYITQPLSGIILDFEDTDQCSEEIFMANIEKIQTYFSGICYKIKINSKKPATEIGKGAITTIKMTFNDSISFNELPDLNFFITSEKNSLGILLNEWMDGDELSIKIERVKKSKSF